MGFPAGHRCLAWDASCDYLRLTYDGPIKTQDAYHLYRAAALRSVQQADVECGDERAFVWRGYRGGALGGVSYGMSDQGALLQCSGVLARAEHLRELPYTGVPRLDLQVTAWFDKDPAAVPHLAARVSDEARRRSGARPWKVVHINGHGAGDTAYLGSRGKSSKFVRVYDKFRESGEEAYRNAVRFEVELTDAHARMAWSDYCAFGGDQVRTYSMVWSYLSARGLELELTEGAPAYDIRKLPKPRSDADRRMEWLRRQVRPSVERLIAAGVDPAAVREALGLAPDD